MGEYFRFIAVWGVILPLVCAQEIRTRGTKQKKKAQQKEVITAQQPTTTIRIQGIVKDAQSKEPLPYAYIKVQGSVYGTVSDEEGRFSLELPATSLPVVLEISYLGYHSDTIYLKQSQELTIELQPQEIRTQEVVISASRISERALESPVSIETMDLRAIQQTPSITPFDALVFLKGVDIVTSSLTFRVINTRGFTGTTNTRFLVRIDGLDLQAPGLNFPITTMMSPPEIDIASMELLPGANSALYGPNAFNGLLNVYTKDPFKYPGLSVDVKLGANHWDGVDTTLQPFTEFAFRYAHTFSNRLGFKVSGRYLRATDWFATNYEDVADYSGTKNLEIAPPGPSNPGYDGLNIYGDEVSLRFHAGNTQFGPMSLIPPGDTIRIARDGYVERALFDYGTYSAKLSGGVYYRINTRLQLELISNLAMGTTMYQSGNRYVMDNVKYHSHKLELKSDRFFLRSYVALEDAGDSYDTRLTAIRINEAWKPNEAWFAQYLLAYNPTTNAIVNGLIKEVGRTDTVPALDHEAARAFANKDNRDLNTPTLITLLRFMGYSQQEAEAYAAAITAGTARITPDNPRFQQLADSIKNIPLSQGGSRFVDKTMFYHTEGQYHFKDLLPTLQMTLGGSFRYFVLNSQGTIFPDTFQRITIYEVGAYVQVIQKLFHERLKLIASMRVDKSQNFDPQYSPRVATVFAVNKRRTHFLRASLQSAFRNPTLQGQYIDLDIGAFHYIGGLQQFNEKYALILPQGDGTYIENAYVESSVERFLETGDSTLLQRPGIKPLQPEKVTMAEIGYKGTLTSRFFFEVVGYYGRYTRLITTQPVIGPLLQDIGTDTAYLTVQDILAGRYRRYRRYTNAPGFIDAWGVTVGFQWAFHKKWTLAANYTYADMQADESVFQGDILIGFNTPKHKTALVLTGEKLWKNFGVVVNHRWVDITRFDDGFARGTIPAYNVVDMAIIYNLPKYPIQLKLGGTNVLNNRHVEVYGGPTLANLYYVQITYDPYLY